MIFKQVWSIDETLTGASTLDKCRPGSSWNEGSDSILSKVPELEPHHRI